MDTQFNSASTAAASMFLPALQATPTNCLHTVQEILA